MYFRFMTAIFDFSVALTSDNVYNNPTVFAGHRQCGVAVGISLLSQTEAEINDIAYRLPVNVRHL